MALKASDLPDNVKRQLSGAVRDQMGSSQYDDMVDFLGEDALLDMVLQSMVNSNSTGMSTSYNSPTAKSTSYESDNPWSKAFGFLWGILEGFGVNLMWIIICVCSSFGFWAGTGILLGGGLSIYLLAVCCYSVKSIASAADAGVTVLGHALGVLLAIGAVGCLLWFGVPWVIDGVGQWWSWLGGH